MNLRRYTSSCESSRFRILRATTSPSGSRTARKTMPIPPSPRTSWRRYGPSRSPTESSPVEGFRPRMTRPGYPAPLRAGPRSGGPHAGPVARQAGGQAAKLVGRQVVSGAVVRQHVGELPAVVGPVELSERDLTAGPVVLHVQGAGPDRGRPAGDERDDRILEVLHQQSVPR